MGRPREFDEDQVVAKAMDLFWEKGYRRTTPSDLMAATGLSKGSLYNTFGSKEGLFLRALTVYTSQQVAGTRTMMSNKSFRGLLENMYEILVRNTEEGARTCLICTTSIECAPDDTEIVQQLADSGEQIQAVFRTRIEQAQRDGEVSADRDPAVLARFIFGVNTGLLVLARAGTSADDLRQVTEEVVDTICL